MKTKIIAILFFVSLVAFAQVPPPPAATSAEVAAGTVKNKYVSPFTLGSNPAISAAVTNTSNYRGDWNNIVLGLRFSGLYWNTLASQGNPNAYMNNSPDRTSMYIWNAPTNSWNGKYSFSYFSNDITLSISAYVYTNANGLWSVWLPDGNSLIRGDDVMLLPSSRGWPTNEADCYTFPDTEVAQLHNLTRPIRYANSWKSSDTVTQYTNMCSDWRTNFMALSLNGNADRAYDFNDALEWNNGNMFTRLTYVQGYMPDNYTVATPITFSPGIIYTNNHGEFKIYGSIYLKPAGGTATMLFTEVSKVADYVYSSFTFLDGYRTNTWTLGCVGGSTSTNILSFCVPLGSGCKFYFSTNGTTAGAIAYITNTIVHN